MKKYICVLLCTVLLLLSGCAAGEPRSLQTNPQQTEATTTVPPTTAPTEMAYTLNKDGEQYLIAFNDSYVPIYGCEYVDYPQFSSIAEMKTAIRTADFTETELWAINNYFPRNDDGSIRVCNLDKLYEPVVPDGFEMDYVALYGERYQFEYDSEKDSTFFFVNLNCPERYEEWFLKEYADFLSYKSVVLTEQTTTEDRNAEVFYYESPTVRFKDLRYVLKEGNKTIYVRETYRLGDTASVAPGDSLFTERDFSDTVPDQVYYFGTQDGIQFHGSFWSLSERPSVEFLLQLGVKPYVETETE